MLSAAERQELAENAMEQLARLVDQNVDKVVLQGGKVVLQGDKVVLQGGKVVWQGARLVDHNVLKGLFWKM